MWFASRSSSLVVAAVCSVAWSAAAAAFVVRSSIPSTLSPTTSSSSSSSSSSRRCGCPTPTAADVEFDEWCDGVGVVRAGIRTATTPRSLGGRGLFAERDLKRGSVVASIPAGAVLAVDDDDGDGDEWQVSLTKSVLAASSEGTRTNDAHHRRWIQSWSKGSSAPAVASFLAARDRRRRSENDDDDDDDESSRIEDFFAGAVGRGAVTREGASAELRERLDAYDGRFDDELRAHHAADLPKWYALVMSRAAYLGKSWNYRVGIVPFFDMLNHSHDADQANVELKAFGDLFSSPSSDPDDDDVSGVSLDRRDMLLVLTKDVAQGQELLTQYDTDVESEEAQLKLWMQYGIPPPE